MKDTQSFFLFTKQFRQQNEFTIEFESTGAIILRQLFTVEFGE